MVRGPLREADEAFSTYRGSTTVVSGQWVDRSPHGVGVLRTNNTVKSVSSDGSDGSIREVAHRQPEG